MKGVYERLEATVPFPISYGKPNGESPNVLIDDEYRECVCFLCSDFDGEKQEIATGFLVELFTTPTVSTHYLVTARHVIDQSRVDGPLYAKINLIDGGFKYIEVPQDNWVLHPQTDVAATVFPYKTGYRVRFILNRMLADAAYLTYSRVEPGDELFFLGLFAKYSGEEQAEPIARFGRIALGLKKVPIQLNFATAAKKVDAYLAETRSWGGESGSPVFHVKWNTSATVRVSSSDPKLIGLLHGHYEIPSRRNKEVSVNSGIGVVIPISAVVEVLNDPELVKQRERQIKEQIKTPTLDTIGN